MSLKELEYLTYNVKMFSWTKSTYKHNIQGRNQFFLLNKEEINCSIETIDNACGKWKLQPNPSLFLP